MGYWENKFKEHFSKIENRIFVYSLISNLLFGHFTTGEKRKKLNNVDFYLKNFFPLIEELYFQKLDYQTSIFPTFISYDRGKNFAFRSEKKPDKEEVYRIIYLMLTGIYIPSSNLLISMDSSEESLWESFTKHLKKEENAVVIKDPKNDLPAGINYRFIYEYLKFKGFPLGYPHIFTFAFLNFFVVWWLKEKEKIKISDPFTIGKELTKKGLSDDVNLIVFYFSKEAGNKVYFFSKLNSFIIKWYGDYLLSSEDKDLILPNFLSNFLIFDKKYKDLSFHTMEKFVYYLLQGYVNGELLDKLIRLKVDHSLKTSRKPLFLTDKFYEKLR